MQTSPSARKFTLRAPRFDSTTGRRRGFWYSWRALAAGLALALVAGSGIAVAAVASTAEAHNPSFSLTCAGFTVSGDYYNSSKGEINTIDAVIDGQPQPTVYFGAKGSKSYVFATSGVSHSYSAVITAWDDADAKNPKGWTKTYSGDSTPCAPPTLAITIPVCTVAGGTVDFNANLGNLDSTHSYSIALSSTEAGATNVPATDFTPGQFPNYAYPFKGVVPGHTYTATVLDKTVNLSASADASSVGCPQDAGIKITGDQCAVAGGTGTFKADVSSLVVGRSYTVTIYDAKNVTINSKDITATATADSLQFPVKAGGTYHAIIVDKDDATKTSTSEPYYFLPCPQDVPKPTLVIDPCTAVDPPSNAVLKYAATGLVPGRVYILTVTSKTAGMPAPLEFTAASSTWPTDGSLLAIKNIATGDYRITVTDKLVPGYTNFTDGTIIECPTLPVLALTPTECTVPGGNAALTVTITNAIPTRVYTVGVTAIQGGATVVAPASFTAPAAGAPFTIPFGNLPPGVAYRVTVTDSVVPTVVASGDISLKVCPGMPSITVQATCNVLGASSVNVSLDKLEANQTYTVNIVNASSNKNVGTATVAATVPTAALKLPNVPNGASYVVTVSNANNTLTGSANIFLKVCDLTTLAFTGANPVGPAVAGIGFLQLGLVLVGLNLVFRRRRTA